MLLVVLNSVIVAIAIVIVFRLRPKDLLASFRRHPLHYSSLAMLGVSIGTSLLFFGLRELDVGIATLLEKLQPVFVFVFAGIFLGEKLDRSKYPYIALALFSSYLLASKAPWKLSFEGYSTMGLLAVLGAAISWALCSVIGKSISDQSIPAVHITFHRFFFGAIFLSPTLLFKTELGLTVEWSVLLVVILVLTAIFSTAGGYILFYHGLRFTSASESALLELVTPVVAVMLGVSFLDEDLTVLQTSSAPLLLWSVYKITEARDRNSVVNKR